MNYRHAYHAGNFADVVKHAVLALILRHLAAKPAPFRVLDTHAGIGLYDLTADEAARTGEWRGGIGSLVSTALGDVPLMNILVAAGSTLVVGAIGTALRNRRTARA